MTDEVTQWTLYGLLDYMAVTLAGSDEPCTEIAAKVLGSGSVGKSLIFGKADRMNALDAALVNGTAAHAHDFDDMNNSLGGHPAAVLLPAIFAVGEEIGASGAALLHAYTVGFETQARIGKGVHLHHYGKRLAPDLDLRHVWRDRGLLRVVEVERGSNGKGDGDCRLVRIGYQVQFWHHGEAAPCGPCLSKRCHGCAFCRGGLRWVARGVRAQPGLLRGL
jgi:hypothetical protein